MVKINDAHCALYNKNLQKRTQFRLEEKIMSSEALDEKSEFERGYADGIREASNQKATNLTLITHWPMTNRSVCATGASDAYYAGFDKGLKDGWQK